MVPSVTISNAVEQADLHRLSATLATIRSLHERTDSPEHFLKAASGTALAADDAMSNPFQVSHFASAAISVAADNLDALRRLTEGCPPCDPNTMIFATFAHWSLLRAGLENAGRAFWLLRPESRSERVIRALRIQAANVINSDAAEKKTPRGPRKPKAQRIARVKDVAARAGLPRNKVEDQPKYSEIMAYAGDQIAGQPLHAEFLWRAASGATHGDSWAVLSLQDREAVDAADGVTSQRLTVSVRIMSVVTGEAVAVALAALNQFDRRNHPPA